MRLTEEMKIEILTLKAKGISSRKIAKELLGSPTKKSTVNDFLQRFREGLEGKFDLKVEGPRILFLDVETSPVKAAVWSLWKQNVGLNMIDSDWFILSYSAKWAGDDPDDIMYNDLRGYVNQEDDTDLLDDLWDLMDEADIIVTQNGIKFDSKKINARFIINGYKPPSHYKQVDTLVIAKSRFGFTSNKLEYMTDKINTKYRKMDHGKFPGFKLWSECLNDNPEAWEEMEVYNKYDVLSLEELYEKMRPWDQRHPNLSLYGDLNDQKCTCGSSKFKKNGYYHTQVSRFDKYVCEDCGTEYRGRVNKFTKDQRKQILVKI